jgi:hypothetical protein
MRLEAGLPLREAEAVMTLLLRLADRLVVRSLLLATVEGAGLTPKEIPSGSSSRASSRTSPNGGGPFEARPQTTAALAVEASENRSVLVCAECGRADDGEAVGWRGYREDLPDGDEQPSLAFFCSSCAAREFDAAEQ